VAPTFEELVETCHKISISPKECQVVQTKSGYMEITTLEKHWDFKY